MSFRKVKKDQKIAFLNYIEVNGLIVRDKSEKDFF